MKGSRTLALFLIFAGIIITYAGFTNKPILSVLGIGNAAKSAGSTGGSTGPNVGTATGGTKAI